MIFNPDSQFLIVADNKYFAMKMGLPDHDTYEQKIGWTENEEDATLFTYSEMSLYYERFKFTIGADHHIDIKEIEANV